MIITNGGKDGSDEPKGFGAPRPPRPSTGRFPSRIDAFGPHKVIADSIRTLVQTERGGRGIALIGSWGSGKSTIINLLRSAASETKTLRVFVFDAWTHEGDPLRRTFLERLINFLTDESWLSKTGWAQRLENLSRHRKESTVKTTPQLKPLGNVVAVFLFLVPMGFALHGHVNSWLALLGSVLIFGPVLVLLLAWTVNKSWKLPVEERWGILGLLVSKTEETTRTETLEEPEPTSLEFQGWFRKLAQEALKGENRLVIVLDNLDRVGRDEARRLWTTMRTFLDFQEDTAPGWASNLWTLVPFDKDGISKIWDNKLEPSDITDRFLDKTFQVSFSVPDPLLSDWRTFLNEQLKLAFPNHTEAEFYRISRIYGILRTKGEPPTPREIKLFVNNVGSTYQTAGGAVPLTHAGLYVALCTHELSWPLIKSIPSQEELEPYLVEGDWRENLASLFFKMPKEKARQVLYGDELEKSLSDGQGDSLKGLISIPGVDYLAERIIDQRVTKWRENEPHILARAAHALAGAGVPSTHTWTNVWTRLISEVRKVTVWNALDAKAGMGLAALIARAMDEAFSTTVVKSLKTTPTMDATEREQRFSQWAEGLLEVLAGVTQAGHEAKVVEFCEESGFTTSGEDYVSLLAAVSRRTDTKPNWHLLRPGLKESEIIEHLKALSTSGKFETQQEKAVEVMLSVQFEWDWSPLVAALSARLSQGASFSPQEVTSSLTTLIRMSASNEIAEKALQSVVVSGWIFHQFQQAFVGSHAEACAACILAISRFDSEAASSSNPNQALSGRNSYRTAVANPFSYPKTLEAAIQMGRVLDLSDKLLRLRNAVSLPRPFLDATLKKLMEETESASKLGASTIREFWPSVNEILRETTTSFILHQAQRKVFIDHLKESGLSLDRISLFNVVLSVKPDSELLIILKTALTGLSKEEWTGALHDPADLSLLIETLQRHKMELGFGHQLQDALSGIASQVPVGHVSSMTDQQLRTFFSALAPPQRELLTRNVVDLLNESDADTSNLLGQFGAVLEDCLILAEDADRLVRQAFRKIVERRLKAEISWLAETLERWPALFRASKSATQTDFRERVTEFPKEETSAEIQAEVERIAGRIKKR